MQIGNPIEIQIGTFSYTKIHFQLIKKVIHYNTHAVYPLTKNNCLPTIKTKRGHKNNNLTKLNT